MLVFVQNKERAKELYDELKLEDFRADVIHSDLSQTQVILAWLLHFLHQRVVHHGEGDVCFSLKSEHTLRGR